VPHTGAQAAPLGRTIRTRFALPFLAFAMSVAFLSVSVVAPQPGTDPAFASGSATPYHHAETQSLAVEGQYSPGVVRDGYLVTKPEIRLARSTAAPAAGKPDPGTAKAIALGMVQARGWGTEQYDCLVALWNRESGWNVYASNAGSGAYGIPQALPGSKMGSVGADWATNPATQITWGLNYVQGRYGTPCGAWASFQSKGWY
jgi:hypothetical protein